MPKYIGFMNTPELLAAIKIETPLDMQPQRVNVHFKTG